MTAKRRPHSVWRQVLFIAILVLAAAAFVPQLGSLETALSRISEARIEWLLIGLAAILATPLVCAVAYRALVLKPIYYRRIVLVQYAGMFVNRLLPAGVGGMGLFVDFFYKQKHTLPQASGVVAANGLAGLLGHAGLLLGVGASVGLAFPRFEMPWLVVGAMVGLLLAGALALLLLRNVFALKIRQFMHDLGCTLSSYRRYLRRFALAVAVASVNTSLHAGALWCALAAFGIDMSIGAVIIILSGGVALATASPTPGGMGGAEAGYTAILLVYGVPAAEALAVALAYRLISYWLPLIPGVIAFWIAQHRRYI